MKAVKSGLLLVLGVFPAIVAGCTVGPDFRKPEMSVPAGFHGIDSQGACRESPQTAAPHPVDLALWWKSFRDPVLDSLVERAIRNNYDLKQAESKIRQARAAQGAAAAGLFPGVNAGASYRQSYGISSSSSGASFSSGSDTTSTGSTSNSSSVSNGSGNSVRTLHRAGFDSSWELDFFGGTRRNIEAARADVEAAVEDRRDVLVTLLSDVTSNYANLRQYQAQIEIARRNLAAQRHTVDITRKRHEAGFVGGLDVANAQAQAVTTEARIPTLESSAAAAVYSLSVLLGIEPAALERELSTAAPILPTPPDLPVGLPSDLIRRRPDIRRAEARIHAATARVGVAVADLFPKFSLTGNLGVAASDAVSLGNISNRSWGWGPSVTWSVFDAGKIRWNIESQKAAEEQSILTYEKAVLTALKDVETALAAYSRELRHNSLLAEAVSNNRRAVDLSMQLYTSGKTDFLNVLNAQRSLYSSEDDLAQSTNALITDLISLYKALGGGWETEDGRRRTDNGGQPL